MPIKQTIVKDFKFNFEEALDEQVFSLTDDDVEIISPDDTSKTSEPQKQKSD
ncbi:MAG: hypothetical protein LBG64_03535 [Pseudomonadales bacterium]|jgi:hypothetical protein|nr:hypothetical protein [Pseudomonadales bacterium]